MKQPSQTLTRIAFGVIIVFVLAQVVWWIVFQQRYVRQTLNTTIANWERDAEVANGALARGVFDAALHTEFLEAYPHLRFVDGQFRVDMGDVAQVRREQLGHVRMFAYEGPFFVLVVMLGLYIIHRSLRAERELKQRQQNFLNAVSHEFKTPISTLRLLIQTALYRSLSPDKQRSYLEKMAGELSRLELTSQQVLAAARLEQSPLRAPLEAFDLRDVVRDIIARLRPGLEARGASVRLEVPPEALTVSIDPAAFSVVLSNLLDNAVKYTQQSDKPVTVRLEPSAHLALLHVEDQGIGLSNGEAKRVFDKFYRVGNEMTRSAKGVGLGLYLVKSITEAMNGWVRCEGLEPGTRFTVVLPRRVAASVAQSEPRLPETHYLSPESYQETAASGS